MPRTCLITNPSLNDVWPSVLKYEQTSRLHAKLGSSQRSMSRQTQPLRRYQALYCLLSRKKLATILTTIMITSHHTPLYLLSMKSLMPMRHTLIGRRPTPPCQKRTGMNCAHQNTERVPLLGLRRHYSRLTVMIKFFKVPKSWGPLLMTRNGSWQSG